MRFKSIKSQLAFWFLVVALTPLIVLSAVTYERRVQDTKSVEYNKLTAIRNLKVAQLNSWLDEVSSDIRNLSEMQQLKTALDSPIESLVPNPHGKETLEALSDQLHCFVENSHIFKEVFILGPGFGKVVASSDRSNIGVDRSEEPYFLEPLRNGELYRHDIFLTDAHREPTMAFSAPIHFYEQQRAQRVLGILVGFVDLRGSLYQLLMNRTGMGETGETFILSKDGIVLSELRWQYEAPMRTKISARPAIRAASGETGVMEADDYRGCPVLAAYTFVPAMQWGFVAKQDQTEVFAPNRAVLLQTLALLILSGGVVVFISLFISRSIARPVAEMAEVSKKIELGDFSARHTVGNGDELGSLAQSLNTMADAIRDHMKVLEGTAELSDTMVSAVDQDDFCTKLLRKLVELTHSHLGACYGYSEELDRFELKGSIGVEPGMLESFGAGDYQGELGKALKDGVITKLTGIPEDTRFTLKTFAGTILPRDMLAIPILVGGRVRMIVAIGSITGYSEHDLRLLEHAWVGMGTALSGILGAEETRRLSKILYAKNMELEAQAQELLAQTEELQGQSEELQQQSEELQQQNTELEVKTREVEEANRLKSEFLSNMSHELRTPLNSVMALSKVLIMQARDKLSEEELSFLSIIERNGRKLLSLINDILDLSKIEAGRIELNPKKLSLRAVIGDVVERLQPVAEQKEIQLSEEIPEDLPNVETDEVRVDQVLQNIIGNAVKFTEHGGVKVSAFADSDRVHIQVADTGIGIPEEQLEHIFDEFHQVDGSSSRRYEGTGLGLAIARKAAELLGGYLSVDSRLGKGSTFTISLPIWWLGETSTVEFMPMVHIPPIAPGKAQKTILVVDDDPSTITIISHCLTQEGYAVIGATSGAQALQLAEQYQPSAITLDIIMPDMDGLEVLQALKANPKTAEIPVIAVSVTGEARTGMALGAAGFIAKPVVREDLLQAVRKILSGRRHPDRGDDKKEELAPSPRILVVEDNEAAIIQVKSILERSGYRVELARSGREAVMLLQDMVPDGIVLDLMMPDMDGFEVLERIRSMEATSRAPVLVLTAKDLTTQEMARLSKENIQQLIHKGDVDASDLLFQIKLMLGSEPKRRPGRKAVGELRYREGTRDFESDALGRNEVDPQPDKLSHKAVDGGRELSLSEIKTGLRRVLIIEDNVDNLATIRAILGGSYHLMDATDGESGLEKAVSELPDLILLDMALPKMDGYSVVKGIRADEDARHIPVIALTAKAMKGDRERILEAGCDDYISKPIELMELVEKVRAWLA